MHKFKILNVEMKEMTPEQIDTMNTVTSIHTGQENWDIYTRNGEKMEVWKKKN